jgi:uncharacterized protein involved in exopolysaccharide biosynthesis
MQAMNGTVSLPSSIVIRDLLLSVWFSRRRIVLIMTVAVAAAVFIALQFQPRYQSKSSVLVLLGPEYGVRQAAGQQNMTSFNVQPEEVLHTEAGILDSNDLHRSVIEEVGLENLYPDLLKSPGPVTQYINTVKSDVRRFFGLPTVKHGNESSPLDRATRLFESNFGASVDQKSDIIELYFQHPNPVLAAKVLSVLEARYLELRTKLFSDKQFLIIEAQEKHVRAQLAAANARLDDFRRTHNISNFAERQRVLLAEQGALEDDLEKVQSAIAGMNARIGVLSQQLKMAGGQPNGKSADAANALQNMVREYRDSEERALTTYRGSPAYDLARTARMKAQEQIATMRSTQAFGVQQDLDKTEADLRANSASREAIKAQLESVRNDLASIDADEGQLHALETVRDVLEESYRAVAKVATDRQMIESVDENRQPSVRIVEAPNIPDTPEPIRRDIVLIGGISGLILSTLVTLMSGFFRGAYLRPEALEVDTGLAVLTVVPDHKSLAGSTILVIPG